MNKDDKVGDCSGCHPLQSGPADWEELQRREVFHSCHLEVEYWRSKSENDLFGDTTKAFLKVALKQLLPTFMEPREKYMANEESPMLTCFEGFPPRKHC